MFHCFFQFLCKVQVLIYLFFFLQFYLMVFQDGKVHNSASYLFFVDYHQVWSSSRYLVIRLNLKILENFMRLVLQDRFWFVHIPFIRMVKFQFIALFPVDHLTHSVVSCLILSLYWFASSTYYVIDRFISITTLPTFAILLRLIYACFDIVGPYNVILCCYQKRFSFILRFPFLSHVQVFLCEISFVAWNVHRVIFLPIFVFWLLFSVDAYVVCIVSEGINQYSSVLVYESFESYRCIDAILNAGNPLPPSFIDTYPIYQPPPLRQDMTQGQFLSGV